MQAKVYIDPAHPQGGAQKMVKQCDLMRFELQNAPLKGTSKYEG